MAPQQESALELCQRAAAILREVELGVLVPGTEMLAQWEIELGQAGALLEEIHESMKEKNAPQDNPAFRQALQDIRRTAGKLKTQFEHGSNYCMGLLQIRLGTGYSELGLPVLAPTESRGSFEG
jgi:hypothetical protein